jgi:peroxiredoxin
MPSMERLHQKLAGTDFRIVAVSVDGDAFYSADREGPPEIMAFVNQMGLTFDILHDPSGAIRTAYQTTGVPESFVIDRDGTIVKKVIGAAEWDGPVNEALIQRLLDAR